MPEILKDQKCPICGEKSLSLTEDEREVPFFGRMYMFSMNCEKCKYHKADVEAVEDKEPCKFTLDITSEKDMHIRVVRSSQAVVKVPYVTTIEPGPGSSGYVTNVEGVLNRIKHQIEVLKETEEEDDARKKAKNLLKKINRIMSGEEPSKLIIEDPSGNSAIISEKAVKGKLVGVKKEEE